MALLMNELGEFVEDEQPVRHLKLRRGRARLAGEDVVETRRCDVCGSLFVARGNKRRCSAECSEEATKARKRRDYYRQKAEGRR